jgi:GTP pyrophosphokinase
MATLPTVRDQCTHGDQFRSSCAECGPTAPTTTSNLSAKLTSFPRNTTPDNCSANPTGPSLEVALVLAEEKMDPVAIAAGLLRLSQRYLVTVVDIRKEWRTGGAHRRGVTKISAIDFATREEQQAENLRKMMLAMVDDIRVVLIKLADRLHNMRTLEHLPPERQQKIAKETLEIYAPIAHRLGMGKIRGELEDLGFRYVDPIAYRQVHDAVEARRKAGKPWRVGHIPRQAERGLRDDESRIGATASAEAAAAYCGQQVYDLYAMRVITKSVQDYTPCWASSTIMAACARADQRFHRHAPANLYQSLHTSVISEEGTPFEVQIRTEEMHKMAEEGIAAHWKYKDGPVSAQDEQRLAWLRQVVEWQRDVSDPSEFLSTLKIDLYPEEVYTFTPKAGGGPAGLFALDCLSVHRSRPRRGSESEWPHGSAALQTQRRHR